MTVHENMGEFDLDLRSSGGSWCGTFVALVRHAVADILSDGVYGPVELTWEGFDGKPIILGGVLQRGEHEYEISLTNEDIGAQWHIAIDDIRRFRA